MTTNFRFRNVLDKLLRYNVITGRHSSPSAPPAPSALKRFLLGSLLLGCFLLGRFLLERFLLERFLRRVRRFELPLEVAKQRRRFVQLAACDPSVEASTDA